MCVYVQCVRIRVCSEDSANERQDKVRPLVTEVPVDDDVCDTKGSSLINRVFVCNSVTDFSVMTAPKSPLLYYPLDSSTTLTTANSSTS